MKKRLFMLAIMMIFAMGFAGNKAYAFNNMLTPQEMSSAVNADVGKNYAVTWAYDVSAINKISLSKRGILSITASKAKSNSFGMVDMNVSVYDANGNVVWLCRDEEDNNNPTFYVGLEPGTYYVEVESSYSSFVEGQVTTYSFGFEANQYIETENNNTKEKANTIETDIAYTSYLGSGFSVTNENKDSYDVYKVKLIKGRKYRLVSTATKGLTIGRWCTKSGDVDSVFTSNSAGKDYVATYTGDHYICIWNYSDEQYKYTIQMKTVSTPLSKTSITSLKAGKKSFVVNWKKVSCSGYQIQYADNKQMKKAVTKTVKSGVVKYQAKKLKAKKKYYVRVRPYKTVGGKKTYAGWSKVKSVTTKK